MPTHTPSGLPWTMTVGQRAVRGASPRHGLLPFLVGVLAVALAIGARRAAAQTRFTWPDTTVNVGQYTTIDQCLAALDRVKRTIRDRETDTVLRDTLPWNPREALAPTSAPVVETAQRCAVRFAAVDSVSLADYLPLLSLYLDAGWDSKAEALVNRRFAVIAPKAEGERTAVLDTVVRLYLGSPLGGLLAMSVRPPRLSAAATLMTAQAQLEGDRVRRLLIYFNLMDVAQSLGDTTRARWAAGQVVAIADAITPTDRQSQDYENTKLPTFLALALLNHQRLLDSLRQSTISYTALVRGSWARVTGMRPETFAGGMPVGERAPAIHADLWLGRADPSQRYPRAGHVSLVIFVDDTTCMPVLTTFTALTDGCLGNWVALRRLAERFPALDLVLVAQTHGYFMYSRTSEPAEEAALLQQWVAAHGVRGTLAVSATPFWRLPAPDRRRIEKDFVNRTAYTFGKSWEIGNFSTFLVDQNGTVVFAYPVSRDTVPMFAELIDVLLGRRAAGV